jgi:3-hydroxyisobutyrate dehydrogenase
MRITVLGTGTMGAGMARSCLRDGHEVTVWNRTAGRAAPLAEDGARVADSAVDAVREAEAVIVMLFDADAVLEVLAEISDDLGDAVVLQTSTIGLDGTRRVGRFAEEHGIAVLDAPVLGTKKPAEDGTLVALVSGPQQARERVLPVLESYGGRVVDLGDEVGAASALKLAVNSWVAGVGALTAQAIALTRGLGLDGGLFLEAIGGGPSDSAFAQLKGRAMLAGDYSPSFAVDNVAKDLSLIAKAAEEAGVATGVVEAVLAAYREASAAGHGKDDMAAVYAAFAPDRT